MHEFMVRGKTTSGEWVYGYYVKAINHWHGRGVHEDWIVTSAIQNGGFLNITGRYPVMRETVGRYIGMSDIHGKDIYQHDLVSFMWDTQPVTMQIVFQTGEFLMIPYGKYDFRVWPIRVSGQEMEVVGNIYDNTHSKT